MRVSHVRGGSLAELALLTPPLVFILAAFSHLGILFLHQVQLERLASALVRDLAAGPAPTTATAVTWLAERGFTKIEPTVEIRRLPGLPRPFPQNNTPIVVLSLSLRRAERGGLELEARAREVPL